MSDVAELVDAAMSWKALVLVPAVFGFAPGVALRFLLLAYQRDDPRRAEYLGELPEVPYSKRPIWVAEQAQNALFEGLLPRVRAQLSRLVRALRSWRRDLTDFKLATSMVVTGSAVAAGFIAFSPSPPGWARLIESLSFLAATVLMLWTWVVLELNDSKSWRSRAYPWLAPPATRRMPLVRRSRSAPWR
jgi:hypothetical protein